MPPPPALKRYLGFSRLTPRSLDAIARVVERDEAFRDRVAASVDEEQVGRAGWLWLARPEGWEEEVDQLEAAAAVEAADAQQQRAERAATKQLAAAQEAVRRLEAQATAQLVELEELRNQLLQERDARTAAEGRSAELAERVDSLTSARGEVVRNLKDTEARLVDRTTEAKAAKARVRELEVEARERREAANADRVPPAPPSRGPARSQVPTASSAPGVGVPAAPGARAGHDARSHAASAPGLADPGSADRSAGPGATWVVDPAAIVGELARAAQGAAGLAAALHDLAGLLAARPAVRAPAEPGPASAARTGDLPTGDPHPDSERADRVVAEAAGVTTAVPAVALARREPLVLPGGMFDDTVEAAEHLLRAPGAVLVVDGYNVTMAGWPELGAAAQRRRLVVALSDLAARTSTHVELVFDGAEVEPLTVPAPTRQLVRVRFSDPGVEADDVVIDLVGRIPAATPVIVASSDNRVRAGSRRWGANLVHARQLVAVLRR